MKNVKYHFKQNIMKKLALLLIITLCPNLIIAQPKQNGRAPVREKRGYNQRAGIDTAELRILYALNAKDIKNEDTYIDLGKLEVGKRIKKYSSEFLAISDQKAIQWKRENKFTGNVPMSFWIGGQKEHQNHWSELVYSDYIIRGNKLTEYACFPFLAERENSKYTEPWPLMKWTLSGEQQNILGHICQKATCHFRGRDFVAWFAKDIPIKGGPWKFGGLPGCILKVYDVQKIYVWEAVAIESGTFIISQYPDKLYPKSTRKSVWQRQKKYNSDYWNAIGWISLEGRGTPPKKAFEPLEKE